MEGMPPIRLPEGSASSALDLFPGTGAGCASGRSVPSSVGRGAAVSQSGVPGTAGMISERDTERVGAGATAERPEDAGQAVVRLPVSPQSPWPLCREAGPPASDRVARFMAGGVVRPCGYGCASRCFPPPKVSLTSVAAEEEAVGCGRRFRSVSVPADGALPAAAGRSSQSVAADDAASARGGRLRFSGAGRPSGREPRCGAGAVRMSGRTVGARCA